MLFDSLSENNFGTPIGIYLIIAIQVKEINLEMKRKRTDLTHIGCIKSIDSCIITCHRIHRQNQIANNQDSYTYAALMCLIDSSSGKIHFWHSGEP